MKLRILSWNLWHALNPYGRVRMRPMETGSEHLVRLENQLERLRSFRKSPYDLFCLQEVNPVSLRAPEIAQALGWQMGSCKVNTGVKLGRLGVPPGLQDGLAILAAEGYSRIVFRERTLSGTALELGPLTLQTGERRKALCMEASVEDHRIAIFNVHLHNGSDHDPAALARKTAEVSRLSQWIAELEEKLSPALILVCGDFNSDPESPCVRPLLEEGFVEASGREPTWDPAVNQLASKSSENALSEVDREWDSAPHVFDRVYMKSTQNWASTQCEVLREPGLSDHFAVSLMLTCGKT